MGQPLFIAFSLGAAFALGGGTVAAIQATSHTGARPVLEASALIIRDDTGEERGFFGVGKEGPRVASFSLRSDKSDGPVEEIAGTVGLKNSTLRIMRNDGTPCFSISTTDDGCRIDLSAKDGHRVAIAATDKSGLITVYEMKPMPDPDAYYLDTIFSVPAQK